MSAPRAALLLSLVLSILLSRATLAAVLSCPDPGRLPGPPATDAVRCQASVELVRLAPAPGGNVEPTELVICLLKPEGGETIEVQHFDLDVDDSVFLTLLKNEIHLLVVVRWEGQIATTNALHADVASLLSCVPTLFVDDFESGDLGRWSRSETGN